MTSVVRRHVRSNDQPADQEFWLDVDSGLQRSPVAGVHDHIFVQNNVITKLRGAMNLLLEENSERFEVDATIANTAERGLFLPRADRDEVDTGVGVIIAGKPGRAAGFLHG